MLGSYGIHLGIHHREVQRWNEAQQHHSWIPRGKLGSFLDGVQSLVRLGRLVVLHQHRPGTPWQVSDEVVQLSADGQRATIPILSFCARAVVDGDAAGVLLPQRSSAAATVFADGSLPAPELSMHDLDCLDDLYLPD